MNPMLKIAYDYGCQQAIQDMEKHGAAVGALPFVADSLPVLFTKLRRFGPNPVRDALKSMSGLEKFRYKNPYALGSALTGGLSGGIAGGLNAEDGQGLKGFLSGAAGGAALGGLTGHFGSKALMGKKDYRLGKKYTQRAMIANKQSDPATKALMQRQNVDYMAKNPISNAAIGKQLAGVAGAGVLGGLGAGYLSGANDKPWYQRMNPFG